MAHTTIRTEHGATGAAVFHAGKVAVMWLGPGAGLFLMWRGQLVRVEHRAADGQYQTVTEARQAFRRMVETF